MIELGLFPFNNRQENACAQLSGHSGGGSADRGDQGQPQRGSRPLFAGVDVPPRVAGVGGVRAEAVAGGRGQPGGACVAVEAGLVHHATLAPEGAPGDWGVAAGAQGDAAADGRLFHQRAATVLEPQDRLAGGAQVWGAGRVAAAGVSAHAPARLRLRLGRPGGGHPADSRLSGPP